jgi:hypothetical protein
MLRSLWVVLAVLVVTGCDSAAIKGSGTSKTETRTVGKFNAVELLGSGRLVIERTGTESLSITADDNLLPLYTSEIRDGTLYLSVEKGKSVSGMRPLYNITVGDLREVELIGSGDIVATKLDGASFSMSIAGSGSATLAGRVDALDISIAGSGSADAAELKAKRGKVSISGSGNVTVAASDELDASIAGSGSILYIGSPKVSSSIAGSGSIKQKP